MFAARWNCSKRFLGRNVSSVYLVVLTELSMKVTMAFASASLVCTSRGPGSGWPKNLEKREARGGGGASLAMADSVVAFSGATRAAFGATAHLCPARLSAAWEIGGDGQMDRRLGSARRDGANIISKP